MEDRKRLKERIEVASGRKKAECVIRDAKVVDVFGHRIIEGSVAIQDGTIVGIGAYEGIEEIDAQGFYVLPGLIDSHVHIESAMCSPSEFAKAVLPRGTTTVIADPHEIANVCGLDGIDYMLKATSDICLSVFLMLPSCVPATDFENSGARLDAGQLQTLMGDKRVLGLGEMMDYPGVVNLSPGVMDKLMLAKSFDKLIDGHSPMLEGKSLSAYAAAGIRTDHECSTPEELRDRLSRGMYVLLREGSAARNVSDLLSAVNESNARHCLFCTDDRQPEDILCSGHIDNHLRIAVKRGLDPITAIQMATINAAECYGLKDRGVLAPGYRADLLIVKDLVDFDVQQVFIEGRLVAKELSMLATIPEHTSEKVLGTIHTAPITPEDLRLPLKDDFARVIRINSHSLVTESVTRKVHRDQNGLFQCDSRLDLLKLAVIERHHKTGNIGLGIIENYSLAGGAIATTIAHDSHNIIVVGDNDEDMYQAIRELIRVGGGITMISKGKLIETLPLPIAGLMSDRSAEYVSDSLKRMLQIAHSTFSVSKQIDPFMTLSFMALPVIPDLKLTDMGLFDVRAFRNVSIDL